MKQFRLPLGVFLLTGILLSFVQVKVDNPMLLLERFVPGAGWIEILIIALYGALVAWKMQDPQKVQKWRRMTWFAFSIVFFSQLILGLLHSDVFLMTGKLHLPVPMMILGGPLYRGHLSVMSILFLSTVLLTGPAWCSHLCYFGALDNLAARGVTIKAPLRNKWALKSTVLLLVVAGAITLRAFRVEALPATLLAGGFGVIGLALILLLSRRQGRMLHCTAYCPIGTLVNLGRYVNPFRLKIEESACTSCMACTPACKYDALNKEHILGRKPGSTCTLCGDCLSTCRDGAIRYAFLRMNAEAARRLYLLLTISLHAATIALARM